MRINIKLINEKINQTFFDTNSALYKKRSTITVTSHLDKMINNKIAVQQKLIRLGYLAKKLNITNKKILDFGSGLGFLSCYLAAFGAIEVTGVEVVENSRKISWFFANEVFKVKNVNFITSIEKLELEKYDIILLNNVISHIDQPFELLKKLAKLLKMNGLIFIEDNNNLTSYFIRRRNKKIWSRTDLEYQAKREKFIADEFGKNNESEYITKLAELTYGLDYETIRWWIKQHLTNKKNLSILSLLKKRAPIDPETLIYHENSFTPKEVCTILFNLGFIISECHPKYVFDFKKNSIVSFVFRTFPNLSLYVAPAYEISGLKCRKYKNE